MKLARLLMIGSLSGLSFATTNTHAQSTSYADMRTWELEGVTGGNWVDPLHMGQPFVNAESGRSVFQTVNNSVGTMFLVSNDKNVVNRAVWGTLQIKSRHTDLDGACTPSCSTNEIDNDWLGFVMGYVNETGDAAFPEQYIGFTWNRDSGATAPYPLPSAGAPAEGIFLVRAAPPDAEGDPVGGGTTIIDSDTGANTGWRYDTEYQFRILYTTDLLRVYINDVLRLEATAAEAGVASFGAGQFGFTNASQANVLFGNVREADASAFDTAPVASDDKLYYGLTWGGANPDTFATNAAGEPLASGILANDYDPDGDSFGLQVGGVLLSSGTPSTAITGTAGGQFTVYQSGDFEYTPPADFASRGPYQDSFEYTLVDEDGSDTAIATVTVQETNTAPDDITLADLDATVDVRIDEGAAAGTPIATIATIESSLGELDEYDYELADASNGAFAIIDDMLVVRDTAALGGPQTHSITIRSTDVEGQSVSKTFSVIVDPNARPTSSNAQVNAAAVVPYVFEVADFPFADTDGNTFQQVLITSFPSEGTLFLDLDEDDVADADEILQVNFNDVATRAQLTSGVLKYLSNSATDVVTSFDFMVSDGTAYAAAASTMTVNVEADSDNDGIPNSIEGVDDENGDGESDYLDSDSDGDGIDDADEGSGDTDGDGTPDFVDSDSDDDGLPDEDEGNGDTDEDGTPDYRDEDKDGDGVPDDVETTEDTDPSDVGDWKDTDGDDVPDYTEGQDATDPNDPSDFNDSDGDGVPTYVEDREGTDPNDNDDYLDTEGDGVPDYVDNDDDNDGVPDETEGNSDTDGDGTPDYLDTDVDGDSVPDTTEGTGDTDGDGVPNYRDTDSDNDGTPDVTEGTGDADDDGIPDYLDSSRDEDNDGIPDAVEGNADSDGDGDVDARDTDSDNDGVPDELELVGTRTDTDEDGIDDRFDVDQTDGTDANGDGIDDATLSDTDGDGRSDLIDPDQDNDGIPDVIESGAYGFDSDNDGLDDRWDAAMPGSTDSDSNGIADDARAVDTDSDGIPDLHDLDSDRDGVSDANESGARGTDIDGDGMDDAFDVDTAGGADANGDGVSDSAKPLDTDKDGVPDYLDLDSDNDSLTDVLESRGLDTNEDALLDIGGTITSAPIDSDKDGKPDLRDVDSNGDGVMDIAGTPARVLDANGDGRIDVHGSDVDRDGIADALDGEPGQRGSRIDNDGDGVPVNQDQDDDGDGVPDSLEGDGDSDNDGAIDRLDRDADNDGIPDTLEMGLPRPTGLDADMNGIDDAFDEAGGVDRDSDGDGISDRLDSDSDNDGIADADEILLARLVGADADGDGIDDAIDADATGGTDANGDGVDDALVNLADTDRDGLEDYRDPDSDNDGVIDGDEDGDFNSDGINDRLQKDPGVKTGLKGGGGSFGWLVVFAMIAFGAARWMRRSRAAACAAALGALCAVSINVQAAESCEMGSEFADGCWSAGVGFFSTVLEPDASQSTWRVSDDSDRGYKIAVEYRFRERWFIEAGYADMGSATLANRNPAIEGTEEVNYKVPSLLVGRLLFDPTRRLNVQVKAGYALLQTDSADRVIEKQMNSHQLALGAGLRVRLFSRLHVNAEYEYYDKDAQQAGLMLRFAF